MRLAVVLLPCCWAGSHRPTDLLYSYTRVQLLSPSVYHRAYIHILIYHFEYVYILILRYFKEIYTKNFKSILIFQKYIIIP
jgi:hypothetical protein